MIRCSTSVRSFGGKSGTARWYRQVYERLREVGFAAPIMTELGRVSGELLELAGVDRSVAFVDDAADAVAAFLHEAACECGRMRG